ncbi:putative spermidine/putrescine transport system permease protein [Fodinibius salinus]|uniref:Putative spermidine/putrescine transport system permease protein n=2 Tax=Fodinibius salinus TaxID=860790 RepID=A0A5D3YJA3_9BACT|nr:putative spermidine/putrescine transport system permease protein [Fodinibius salinus]
MAARMIALAFVFPVLYLLVLSLADSWIFPQLLPEALTLKRWGTLVGGANNLWGSLLLSLIIAFTVATVSTICGFFTSKHLAYHPNRSLWMRLSYFPFVLSPVIYAAVLYYYFIRLGLSGSIMGVILGQLLIAYPYSVILFSGFWSKRMLHIEKLVQTLGGHRWQTYRRVLLPMAQGLLLVCFFQTFLISWFEYGLTTIIGVGKVQTLTLKVFQYINEASFYNAALSSSLLVLPPIILLYFNKRYLFQKRW